jgi:hypothetical protein
MTADQSKLWLDVQFELERHELMIDFASAGRATAYQKINPESRIFAEGRNNERRVWLPTLPSMKYIRGCTGGFAIGFASEELAKKWCDRLIIGHMSSRNKKEVYVVREWDSWKLDELLRSDRTGLRPVTPVSSNGRSVTPTSLDGDRTPPNPLPVPPPRPVSRPPVLPATTSGRAFLRD